MKYKAAIFDLDGTLIHSEPEFRYTVVGKILDDLGVKYSKEDIDRFWFETNRDEIVTKDFGLTIDAFWGPFKKYDTVELRRKFAKTYDDVGFIGDLQRAGCKTGIVTGAPLHIAEMEIGMIGEENFDAIVVAHRMNGFTPKPHPQGLEECLSLLGVNKNEAVYVGNGDEDIQTARNAGVFDILIDRGEYTFHNTKPSLTISSLYELKEFLG
ncbi:MAG: HAD family hydrolase [Nanoarchaeota archaeon]